LDEHEQNRPPAGDKVLKSSLKFSSEAVTFRCVLRKFRYTPDRVSQY